MQQLTTTVALALVGVLPYLCIETLVIKKKLNRNNGLIKQI